MPDVVMVIAPTVFRDEEYALPKSVLESRGAHVVTASVAPGECIGKLGMRAVADSIRKAGFLPGCWDWLSNGHPCTEKNCWQTGSLHVSKPS